MRMKPVIILGLLACTCGLSLAQTTWAQKGEWILGVVSKLEKLREKAAADIFDFVATLQSNDRDIETTESLLSLLRPGGKPETERDVRAALAKFREARALNKERLEVAEQRKRLAENALASVKAGKEYLEAELEQIDFMADPAAWMDGQRKLIQLRLKESSQRCLDIIGSLRANTLPAMKFNDLRPGDVLLIDSTPGSTLITGVDNLLTGSFSSKASHAVSFLKTENGRKLFLDDQPGEGPRIITEEQFLERYGERGAQVAKVRTPLNAGEAKKLFEEALAMAKKQSIDRKIQPYKPDTDYGILGDDVLCSEADWKLLRAAGRDIPKTRYWTKRWAIDFSLADFYDQGQHFLITNIDLPRNPAK